LLGNRIKEELQRWDGIVGADGRPAEGSEGRPSAETLIHCVLAETAAAGSTLHTHSVAGTLLGEHFLDRGGFTLTGYEMLKGLAGIHDHQARVWVPILPNTQDMVRLSERVRELLATQPGLHGFLLAGHGLYTWGETLDQARRHVQIFEFLLKSVARRTPLKPFTG
jgi:methylthioribulose-1-phosphate dehydratase